MHCVISQIATARLELVSVGLRQAGGGSCDAFLSVYAPTITTRDEPILLLFFFPAILFISTYFA